MIAGNRETTVLIYSLHTRAVKSPLTKPRKSFETTPSLTREPTCYANPRLIQISRRGKLLKRRRTRWITLTTIHLLILTYKIAMAMLWPISLHRLSQPRPLSMSFRARENLTQTAGAAAWPEYLPSLLQSKMRRRRDHSDSQQHE